MYTFVFVHSALYHKLEWTVWLFVDYSHISMFIVCISTGFHMHSTDWVPKVRLLIYLHTAHHSAKCFLNWAQQWVFLSPSQQVTFGDLHEQNCFSLMVLYESGSGCATWSIRYFVHFGKRGSGLEDKLYFYLCNGWSKKQGMFGRGQKHVGRQAKLNTESLMVAVHIY